MWFCMSLPNSAFNDDAILLTEMCYGGIIYITDISNTTKQGLIYYFVEFILRK